MKLVQDRLRTLWILNWSMYKITSLTEWISQHPVAKTKGGPAETDAPGPESHRFHLAAREEINEERSCWSQKNLLLAKVPFSFSLQTYFAVVESILFRSYIFLGRVMEEKRCSCLGQWVNDVWLTFGCLEGKMHTFKLREKWERSTGDPKLRVGRMEEGETARS